MYCVFYAILTSPRTRWIVQASSLCEYLLVPFLLHFGQQFVLKCQRGKVKAAYFDALWWSTNWYETTSFLLVFRCAMYSCILALLYQFVVLKHAIACCHFKGKFWWNCCCLDVCLIRFSEPLLIYFAFAINRHFQARHDVCHKATSTFNILTFSAQFTASHYGIGRNLRAVVSIYFFYKVCVINCHILKIGAHTAHV